MRFLVHSSASLQVFVLTVLVTTLLVRDQQPHDCADPRPDQAVRNSNHACISRATGRGALNETTILSSASVSWLFSLLQTTTTHLTAHLSRGGHDSRRRDNASRRTPRSTATRSSTAASSTACSRLALTLQTLAVRIDSAEATQLSRRCVVCLLLVLTQTSRSYSGHHEG